MLESYHSSTIIISTLLAYFSTRIMAGYGFIAIHTHRKIWNVVLAITFIVSCFAGLALAVLIDNKFSISWYRELLWVHVAFGIAMTIIALFHAAWHGSYYKMIFKSFVFKINKKTDDK